MVTGVNYIGNHGSDLLVRSTGTNAFVKAGTLEPSGNCNGFSLRHCNRALHAAIFQLQRRDPKPKPHAQNDETLHWYAELSGVSPDLR